MTLKRSAKSSRLCRASGAGVALGTAGTDERITSTCQRTPGRAGVTQLRHSAAVPYGA